MALMDYAYKTLLNKISPNQKIISYDLRGHGKSTVPAEPEKLKSWQRYRDDLISILEKNNEPSILIGHSLGGTTSLLVAFKRPELVSKIILIDPVLLPLTYWLGTKAIQSIGLIEKVHPMVKGALVRKKTWEVKKRHFNIFQVKNYLEKLFLKQLMIILMVA
jgi:pimeloyl-ACP methyl ester carboxylesterase